MLNSRRRLTKQRDFVSVHDVARACKLAAERPAAAGHSINIGSGRRFTVNEVAQHMGQSLGRTNIAPQVSGRYRAGDIRHCFADISLAGDLLGFTPQVSFEDGLVELTD